MPTPSCDEALPPLDVTRFREVYPPDLTVSLMQRQIQDAENIVTNCDSEIQRLRGAIASLEERKTRITDRINEHRAYISPIRKVPTEIWTHVFLLSLSGSSGLFFSSLIVSDNDQLLTSTLNLSHVCSFWRDIVVSTPKLWSHLDLHFGEDGPPTSTKDVVALYLQRSGSSPLHFNLRAPRKKSDLGVVGWDLLMMLLDSFNRWFDVKLNLSYRILQCSKFEDAVKRAKAASSCTTLLQSFAISFGDTHVVRRSPFLFELLSTASQLESLYLDKFRPDFKLPFSQLHELNVQNLDSSVQILECLSMCPDLRETDLSCLCVVRHDGFDGAIDIHLPKLHTFYLCLATWDTNVHHLFPSLNLPALCNLGILVYEACPDRATLLSRGLQDLITRSGCQLTALTLSTGLSDKNLVQILSLTPNLTHLDLGQLECKAVTNSFLEKMTLSHERSDAGHTLVPHLTYFQILYDAYECEISPVSLPTPSLILAMVKSRRMPDRDSKGLQTFSIEAYHTEDNNVSQLQNWVLSFIRDAEPGLMELEEDGLELDLLLGY